MVKFAPRSLGLAEAVLGDLDLLRPQRGRVRGSSSGFRFSPRASQLWRFALGSNAAVIKKIRNGGTANGRELATQMDYLFSKSEGLFGNAVVLDADGKSLSKEERTEIIGDWSDAWRGSPKNGHTTHLLLSFPADVRPDKAKLIAEVWAFEMFQSGEHQDDAWAYVAALHTDRPHPHVHMVINNRGLLGDSWFYMARDHVFNLDTMKERLVAIAAEEGVFLDATSRAERGLMSYGSSRGEIEAARREGRAPEPVGKEGRALDEALATFSRTAETMRGLAQVAALTGLPEVHDRIAQAEQALEKGGILHRFQGTADAGRADLERHFEGWMAGAEDRIRKLEAPARKELREELYGYAAEIARGLGDARGAELLQRPPQSALYGSALEDDTLVRGRARSLLPSGGGHTLRSEITTAGSSLGLGAERISARLETGAANAWEERNWIRSDLKLLAGRNRVDLRDPVQGARLAKDLQAFYDGARDILARATEVVHEAAPFAQRDRVIETLRAMARAMQAEGKVQFRSDAHADQFALDIQAHYGAGILGDLAARKTDILAHDFPDERERRWIARAVTAAGKAHVALGVAAPDDGSRGMDTGRKPGDPKVRDRER